MGLDFPGPVEMLVGRPVGQVGIIVRDLESSCRRYSALWQCGPWRVYTYSQSMLSDQRHHGELSGFAVRLALNPTTPEIELLQPLEGPSAYDGWLDRRGEGLHHLAVYLEDADEAIASFAVTFSHRALWPIQSPMLYGYRATPPRRYFEHRLLLWKQGRGSLTATMLWSCSGMLKCGTLAPTSRQPVRRGPSRSRSKRQTPSRRKASPLDVRGRRIPVGKRHRGCRWIAAVKSGCWTRVRQLGTFALMVTRPTCCSRGVRHAQALR